MRDDDIGARRVTSSGISRLAQSAGSAHRILRPDLAPGEPVIDGRFDLWRLKSGILLHTTELRDLHDLATELVVDRGLTISVVLEGVIDFSIDRRDFSASALHPNERCGAACSAYMIDEEAILTRRARKGSYTRKVNISLDEGWLEDMRSAGHRHAAVREFVTTHLAFRSWRATPRLAALAEQILNPPDLCSYLREMHVESRSIELVAEALACLSGEALQQAADAPSAGETMRARAARDFVEANLDRPLSLAAIAREVGLSSTSLQRQFKQAFATTVVEYIRARRLARARNAIERDGLSIAEAAYLAGYTTPANFTTAFKRAFGKPPRAINKR